MKHIVIIGNGISGITAARHIRKQSEHRITVVSAETDYFFSRTALMYIFMGHLRYEHTKPFEDSFWTKNRIELRRTRIEAIEVSSKKLRCEDGSTIAYDVLVIATGSTPNRFGWPGQDLPGVQGFYSLQDLETLESQMSRTKQAVLVGGGLIGVEMAEMLHSRGVSVTFLIREATFWNMVLPVEEGQLVQQHMIQHGIILRLNAELKEILPDGHGQVRGISTTNGDDIPCQFVGLTVGVSPNIGLVKNSPIEVGRGVLVNSFFETNIPEVYAIGDCAEFREPAMDILGGQRKKIEQIWYTGRMHGETLAQTICGKRTAYRPGVFFNSAKFFDLEYQTYGTVNAHLAEGEGTFYWQAPSGRHCLRINFLEGTAQVIGLHALGIRLRHDVCERWIREKKMLTFVLEHLPEANFDPEFFRQFEPEIHQEFTRQTGQPIQIKARKGLLHRLLS